MMVWVGISRMLPEAWLHPIFREIYEDLMAYPRNYTFTQSSLTGRACQGRIKVRIPLKSGWQKKLEPAHLQYIHLRYGIGHKVRKFVLNRWEKRKLIEALVLRQKWGERGVL